VATAIVVGAGIGGLAVAGALARRDWNVTLVEQSDRLSADQAGLLLWPSGVAALRRLGLAGGLDAIASPVHDRGVRRPDGGWLVRPDEVAAGTDTPLVVSRADLHDALVAGLGNRIDIRTGVTVQAAHVPPSAPPTVVGGGTTWQADLIVGADGVDSAVRRRLAPESTVVSAGCTAWRALIPWYRASGLVELRGQQLVGATGGETVGGGHRFRYAILGHRGSAGASSHGGIYWTATVPGAARPESPQSQLALLRRWFVDWHAPIGDLIAATGPADLIQHAVGELWPVPRTFAVHAGSGGYALIGDAAHAMSHHLGTGACLALEDAAALVESVGPSGAARGRAAGLPAALDRYAQQRRRDVMRIGRQSRRVGAALATTRASVRERDAALGLAPGPLGRASQALRGLRRS
jgi:2-polyprenyl-6-methoxyphenol hydroxylase-like FAD-dependent oxidoreductase